MHCGFSLQGAFFNKGPFSKQLVRVSRELRSEENGIFLVVAQTCFNHRNEHKIQLVPSAIVWNSFSLQPPAAGGFNVTFF